MSVFNQIYRSILACSLILFSQLSLSHDGHDVQDIIIPNLGNIGQVQFATTCGEQESKTINTGVALLHHMMYAQAEKHFAGAINTFPHCAILHWGYAMTLFHPLWPDKITEEATTRGATAIKRAKSLAASKREQAYIHAAAAYYHDWQNTPERTRLEAWAEKQQQLYLDYPKDIDATAFYALSQLVTASKKDPTFSQNKRAGELLNPLLKNHPSHPGAIHYTIHAYDNPVLASHAIEAARAYDKIAPDVPHALHMPSHIFVRLGMWEDAANWNIRSANAALKYPVKDATSLHYTHAIDYLVYSYIQANQLSKAKKAFEQVAKHHPIQAVFPTAYALTTIPARLALESHQWQQASDLAVRTPNYIDWDKFPEVEAITYFTRGLGAARTNQLKVAEQNLTKLDDLYEKTLQKSPQYWAILVDAQRKAVAASISFAKGEIKLAITQLKQAADIEDSVDKNPVTPGAVLPIRELLGDMLFLNQDYSQAIKAYQACLKINPNRLNSLTGIELANKKL
ncbi:tetratricopeptide repeat protein [Paraglaciecola aquimarina]|uniref:Tetratricopeptide repeat protein n=1 Tax=Paraglaciecola algarum TaxID=3050085 RepID=A0ABS9DE54_9ALTE|nr:tetratricopeptide repeat protein [Paraglaciecola sp. G1-23]MCF2949871.1 tetratricopeptide repeat protein [Paraglaciecola sp. G1-23]